MKRKVFRRSVLTASLAFLLCIAGCAKKSTKNDFDEVTYLQPLDGVASNIDLIFYAMYMGDSIFAFQLQTEGEFRIDSLESGAYDVYARASGYYTELYHCYSDYGCGIWVDLDSVPEFPNAIAATICEIRNLAEDVYYGEAPVQITGPQGFSVTATTDVQGRLGIGNLPRGVYRLDIACMKEMFTFEITNTCGTDYAELSFRPSDVIRAPNIYLYPEEETDVAVQLGFPSGGYVLLSQPPYDAGWQVHVTPDGMIDGQYEYLFYEAALDVPMNTTNGWVIDGSNLEGEFRSLMAELGFAGREIDDFVDFWAPELAGEPWYAIYPQDANSMVQLDIFPLPDRVLRAFFLILPLNKKLSIPAPPDPQPFTREGFTVVEWGVFAPSGS